MSHAHPIPRPMRIQDRTVHWRIEPGSERWPAWACLVTIVGLSSLMWAAIFAGFIALFGGAQ
jgi:hypothetical protein